MENMHRIDSFGFGEISINGRWYRRDLILFPDHIQSDWRRTDGHLLQLEDLETVLVRPVGKIIIGTGVYGRMKVAPRVIRRLQEDKLSFEILTTDRAIESYRKTDSPAGTVCALHLTC